MSSKFKQIIFIVSLVSVLFALAIFAKPQTSSQSNQQATSASTTPNMTVLDVLPGVGFNQKLTLADENGLNEAGKHYALTLP